MLKPQSGAQRGKLMAWVRVGDAALTARGGQLAGAGARHAVRVSVSAGGAKGSAVVALSPLADGVPREHGYLVKLRAVGGNGGAAGATGAVPVRVTARQTLDLTGDGSVDVSRSDSESVRTKLQAIPALVQPRDGIYVAEKGDSFGTNIHVQDGHIVLVYAQSMKVRCSNISYDIAVPIDPTTGAFTVDVPKQPVRLLDGRFLSGGGVGAEARVEIIGGRQPAEEKCKWSDPGVCPRHRMGAPRQTRGYRWPGCTGSSTR